MACCLHRCNADDGVLHRTADQKQLLPNHPLRLVVFLRALLSSQASIQRDYVQTDILDGRPDNGQSTGLRREHIDLVGALDAISKVDTVGEFKKWGETLQNKPFFFSRWGT